MDMARPLKDTEGHEPAIQVSYRITRPRLERLAEIAASWGCSQSVAVERLIDEHDARVGHPDFAAARYLEDRPDVAVFTEPRQPVKFHPVPASLPLAAGRTKRGKGDYAPVPKKAAK